MLFDALQFFLITPKLLSNLTYEPVVDVKFVFNGMRSLPSLGNHNARWLYFVVFLCSKTLHCAHAQIGDFARFWTRSCPKRRGLVAVYRRVPILIIGGFMSGCAAVSLI